MPSVTAMWRILDVPRSGFGAWCRPGPSERRLPNQGLVRRNRLIHPGSWRAYLAPRVHAEVAEEGYAVSHKRVARPMRLDSPRGISGPRGNRTTHPDQQARAARDRLDRAFEVATPDILWVSDFTYVPTDAGFLCLVWVIGAFSRRAAPVVCPIRIRAARRSSKLSRGG